MTPEDLEAAFRAAAALQMDGRAEESLAAWRDIVERAPGAAPAHANLGALLRRLGRAGEAEAALRRALALDPDLAEAHYNLGVLLADRRAWDEAETALRAALARRPGHLGARANLAQLLLSLGRYAEGWPLFEARKEVEGLVDRLPFPEWRGEAVAGRRILIWPEQGFGDQIQFARFAPLLRAQGAHVTLGCFPPLAALFESLGVDVLPVEGQVALRPPDLWTTPMSLPLHLGITLENLPAGPYLAPSDERRARWAGFAPQGGVGLVWRGNPEHVNDRHRSLPSPGILAPLATAGARFVDLQAPRGDFADTAAILEQLDLVITVDTAMAHLAGALGRPCWLMLSRQGCDWRWLHDREDSPWYPSLRLFRQPAPGDWASVVEEMVQAWRAGRDRTDR